MYPPPVAGRAEPSSAYVNAVNTVIIPFNKNATIKAGPAASIPGPTKTKMAPPIIAATPTMTESVNDKLLTRPVEDFSELNTIHRVEINLE
jgi:hypothetical protein